MPHAKSIQRDYSSVDALSLLCLPCILFDRWSITAQWKVEVTAKALYKKLYANLDKRATAKIYEMLSLEEDMRWQNSKGAYAREMNGKVYCTFDEYLQQIAELDEQHQTECLQTIFQVNEWNFVKLAYCIAIPYKC